MSNEQTVVCTYELRHLARNFKAVRLAFGCSLDEIAANLGCIRQTVAKYERPDYEWKPYDYFALRTMFELLAYGIENTEYYLDIWLRLVEGLNNDGGCVSEEHIEKLANRILQCNKSYSKKIGLIQQADRIREVLTEEGYLDNNPKATEGS